VKKRDFFFAGWGIVTLFVQLPVVNMILGDPQTLLLGSWNWPAFTFFCVITFVGIPAAVGFAFWSVFRWTGRFGILLLVMTVAHFIAMDINFHHLQFHYADALWRRPAVIGIFLGFIALIWQFHPLAIRILKVCSVFSLGIFALFAFQTWPGQSAWLSQSMPPVAAERSGAYPVFFLTFEKLVSSYVMDTQGQVLADQFPNLARFAQQADLYPNAYANSQATGYALKTLYTGRFLTYEYDWVKYPNIRDILDESRRIFMVMDVMDYCRPKRDTCVRVAGMEDRKGLGLTRGWYKTYLRTILPGPLQNRMALAGWHFTPWKDLWGQEQEDLRPGEKPHHRVGTQQFEKLTEFVRKEKGNANFYIMHNVISDGPGTQTSVIPGRTELAYQEDLKTARANLAYFDRELGKFLDVLKEAGIFEQSLILVTADTADDPYARNVAGEPQLPYSPEFANVFLAMKRPQQSQGRVIRSVMRQLDVLPTLLTELGIDIAPYAFEGVPVTDEDGVVTLAQRPVEISVLTDRSGRLHYQLAYEGRPFHIVKRR
jgi:hypothetical protein